MQSRQQLFRESWRRFGEVLPEMRRPGFATLLCGGVAVACGLCLLVGWMAERALPYGALIVQGTLVVWSEVGMYAGFWSHRADYRRRYGMRAYRHLFYRFLLPSLVAALAAGCFPLLVSGERLLPPAIAYAFSAYLLVTIRLMERRGLEVFWNVELRAFVYSVFPERGPVLTSGIFYWLRHPVYSGMMRTVFVLALVRNNASAVLCAAMSAAGLWLWARMEERELEQRDADYAAYRRRVPAFFATHPLRFWRFMLTGRGTPT